MPAAPIVQAVRENGVDMFRVVCMALMNAIPTAVTVVGATFATNAVEANMKKTVMVSRISPMARPASSARAAPSCTCCPLEPIKALICLAASALRWWR